MAPFSGKSIRFLLHWGLFEVRELEFWHSFCNLLLLSHLLWPYNGVQVVNGLGLGMVVGYAVLRFEELVGCHHHGMLILLLKFSSRPLDLLLPWTGLLCLLHPLEWLVYAILPLVGTHVLYWWLEILCLSDSNVCSLLITRQLLHRLRLSTVPQPLPPHRWVIFCHRDLLNRRFP